MKSKVTVCRVSCWIKTESMTCRDKHDMPDEESVQLRMVHMYPAAERGADVPCFAPPDGREARRNLEDINQTSWLAQDIFNAVTCASIDIWVVEVIPCALE